MRVIPPKPFWRYLFFFFGCGTQGLNYGVQLQKEVPQFSLGKVAGLLRPVDGIDFG